MIDVERNGRIVSWSDYIFKFGGERVTGVTKLSYAIKRTRTLAYGQSRSHRPIGKTSGKTEIENIKVTMHRHSWSGVNGQSTGVRQWLQNQSDDGVSVGNPDNVQILVQLFNPSTESTIEFQGCALVSDSKSAEENPDPNFVELEFIFEGCVEDGSTIYDSSEEVQA
jgi:hypothetical protein